MPLYVYAILVAGWVLWLAPFLRLKLNREKAQQVDRSARWGVIIQAVAYWIPWAQEFWLRTPEHWRVALSVIFFLLGSSLSWNSTGALGRHWRVDAGLNPDHQLVRTGAYRLVRHPLYASMLCMLLGNGFLVTPLPMLSLSVVVFMLGTEIRVRIEDRLLESRFGEEARRYRDTVPAYVPWLR